MKLGFEIVAMLALIVLNLRGIKESVMVLLPIFMIFLVTHAILIVGADAATSAAIGDGGRDGRATDFTTTGQQSEVGLLARCC